MIKGPVFNEYRAFFFDEDTASSPSFYDVTPFPSRGDLKNWGRGSEESLSYEW
jgi:hypothetical protein